MAEAYRSLSSELLQLAPDNLPHQSFGAALTTLSVAVLGLGAASIFAIQRFDASRSE